MMNLKRVDYGTYASNSDGNPIPGTYREHTVLFNSTRISYEEVMELIDKDMVEYDNRVILITPAQADNMKSLKEKNNEE